MKKRYSKNFNALTEKDMKKLKNSHICIIGCGGLGGYILESTSRIGIGKITAIDKDVFDETNLNRQLLSHTHNLGFWKADEAKKRINKINPEVEFLGIKKEIKEENIEEIIPANIDCLIDALDNVKTRILLEKFAKKHSIPLVHGAIGGWFGQIATIMPGDDTISKIYGNKDPKVIEEEPMGNLPHVASLIASIQASEVIKLLINKGNLLANKMIYVDLKNNTFNTFEI